MAMPAELISEVSLAKEGLAILDALFTHFPAPNFQVRLWDGSLWGATEQPRFTLVLNHPAALRRMFLSATESSLGEAYVCNDFNVEGSIEAAMELADALVQPGFDLSSKLHLVALLKRLPERNHRAQPARLAGWIHSRDRDRRAIAYHYNLPTDFYRLFLDQRLVYSCAYFERPQDDLDTAQFHKLDYLCRKLRLRPGHRLLDVGCGWGALVLHAARHYGVNALGVTISAPQAAEARRLIEIAGLSARCRVEVCDYRDLDKRERYDRIVSVGMFEHVGEKMFPEYFSRAWQLLEPGGVFLNHGIAYNANYHRKGESFTNQYVFPDGELVPIHVTARAAEQAGFEIRDVESLREHYALTLRHWVKRLESCEQQAIRISNEQTYRIWRLYMAGSAHGFHTGRLNLYQVLLAKPDHGHTGLPLTREDWYDGPLVPETRKDAGQPM